MLRGIRVGAGVHMFERLVERRKDARWTERGGDPVSIHVGAQIRAYPAEDDRYATRRQRLHQVADGAGRRIIDGGDRCRVHHQAMHRGRRLRDEAFHFIDESRFVRVEQVGAETVDDQAGLGLHSGKDVLRNPPTGGVR